MIAKIVLANQKNPQILLTLDEKKVIIFLVRKS